jgi:DNA-binding SARP family transcriptional activator/tetratricopeptide (TPR) repeat protein
MEIGLLGPIEIRSAHRSPSALGPPQRKLVLAALAVNADRLVPTESLIDRIWGERPPAQARPAVHAHITRLRRVLDAAGTAEDTDVRLVNEAGGYVLRIDPDLVDVHRFHRLVNRYRGGGVDPAEAADGLHQALNLWRGSALGGVSGDWSARMRDEWNLDRVEATVAWAEAELRLGRPTQVLGTLRTLVADHPFIEPLIVALIQALMDSGRHAEALEQYAASRKAMVETLGAEPGPALQELFAALLSGHGEAIDDARRVPDRVNSIVPAQLPVAVRGFVGRAAELVQLDAVARDVEGGSGRGAMFAVSGPAGIGKTALTLHWAHRSRPRFPDGQLYADLRGFDPLGTPADPVDVVHDFLVALGMTPARIPVEPDARVALYRSVVADRRMLVVLDNARHAGQVRPLLPGSATSVVVVTSRNRLTSLVAAEGAVPLLLELLDAGEARELLAQRLGTNRLTEDALAVDEILRHCDGLPLALAIMSARIAASSRTPLGAVTAKLRHIDHRLNTLADDTPRTDIQAVFSWSYHSLTSDSARLFRSLGLHPGADLSAATAASLAGSPVARVQRSIDELVQVSLVSESKPGRYALHDLLRLYSQQLWRTGDGAEHRDAAIRRMLDHYVYTAHLAARLLSPHRDPIELDACVEGVTPQPLADDEAALAWFGAEHSALLAAIDAARSAGLHRHTLGLAWALDDFLDRRGYWSDNATVQQAALDAAAGLGDQPALARVHRSAAAALLRLDNFDGAADHLQLALKLSTSQTSQAHTRLRLAWLNERRDRYTEAREHARDALALYRSAGQLRGQAQALNALAWYDTLLGDHERAVVSCEQALAMYGELADRFGQASALDSLGYARHQLGQFDQAAACFGDAAALMEELGDRYNAATVLTHLGDCEHAGGRASSATQSWEQALALLDSLDHPDAATVRSRLHRHRHGGSPQAPSY